MAQTIQSLLLMLNHVFSRGILYTRKIISVTIPLESISCLCVTKLYNNNLCVEDDVVDVVGRRKLI